MVADVSVVVAIYNTEKYLDKCLLSIVNQTLQPKEVLMINDGSTDQSMEIARRYEEKYENFSLIVQDNKGLSAARNRGIAEAQGKYICFVDSDDYIDSNYIASLYEGAEKFDADMTFGDFYKMDEQDKRIEETMQPCCFHAGKIAPIDAISNLFITGDNHYATTVVVMWNKLIKTAIMKQLRFREGVFHEDEFMIMPLLLQCNVIVWVDETIYGYRQQKESITHDSRKLLARADVLSAYEERILLSEKNKLPFTWETGTAYMKNITIVYYTLADSGLRDIRHVLWYIRMRALKGIGKYFSYIGKRQLLYMLLFIVWPDRYKKKYY